jgi:hypothetical protein
LLVLFNIIISVYSRLWQSSSCRTSLWMSRTTQGLVCACMVWLYILLYICTVCPVANTIIGILYAFVLWSVCNAHVCICYILVYICAQVYVYLYMVFYHILFRLCVMYSMYTYMIFVYMHIVLCVYTFQTVGVSTGDSRSEVFFF